MDVCKKVMCGREICTRRKLVLLKELCGQKLSSRTENQITYALRMHVRVVNGTGRGTVQYGTVQTSMVQYSTILCQWYSTVPIVCQWYSTVPIVSLGSLLMVQYSTSARTVLL